MFAYCTERLHLSDAEAYLRIAAARASREHPVLLEMLADGRLHLTAIAKLAPHLTPANRDAVLERAIHKSKREIEELVAELAPRPDVVASMRKLPERRIVRRPDTAPRGVPDGAPVAEADVPASPVAAPTPVAPVARGQEGSTLELRLDAVRSGGLKGMVAPEPRRDTVVVEPLSPARYRVQFTASAELRDKLERLRALMRSSVPDGRVVAADGGPAATRHVPAAVRRAVYERDGGRCRFVDERGRRCTAREGLEFHHRHPFGYGGGHAADGLSLLCHTHNRLLAEVDYGRAAMALRCLSRTGASGRGCPPGRGM